MYEWGILGPLPLFFPFPVSNILNDSLSVEVYPYNLSIIHRYFTMGSSRSRRAIARHVNLTLKRT